MGKKGRNKGVERQSFSTTLTRSSIQRLKKKVLLSKRKIKSANIVIERLIKEHLDDAEISEIKKFKESETLLSSGKKVHFTSTLSFDAIQALSEKVFYSEGEIKSINIVLEYLIDKYLSGNTPTKTKVTKNVSTISEVETKKETPVKEMIAKIEVADTNDESPSELSGETPADDEVLMPSPSVKPPPSKKEKPKEEERPGFFNINDAIDGLL